MILFEGEGNTERGGREQMTLKVTCSSVYKQENRKAFSLTKIGNIHGSQLYNLAPKRKINQTMPYGREKFTSYKMSINIKQQ